jgi:hypothetical protein
LNAVNTQKSYCDQLLLLPTIAVELLINYTGSRLNKLESTLKDIERLVGHKKYRDRPRGNPLEIDFLSTTRSLNYVSKKVGTNMLRVLSMLRILKKMREFKRKLCAENKPQNGRPEQEDLAGSRLIDERIDYFMDSSEALFGICEHQEKRASTLLQVVGFSW